MAQRRFSNTSPEIKEARDRLDLWRKGGSRGRRIPEPLWETAVDLAKVHGVNPVAKGLRLDYYDLKKRLVSSKEVRSGRRNGFTAEFVEMRFPPIGPGAGCLVTLEDGSGERLTISLPGSCGDQVAGIIQALRGGRG
jgi:hypothetical protein